MNIEEKQVIDIFKELVTKYEKNGVRLVRDGHSRVSLFGKQCRFDLSKSFPLLTHRQTFMRGTFEELKWFLSGSTDNQVLKDKGINYWTPWEGIVDTVNPTQLGPIYGHQWRNFGEVKSDLYTNYGEVDYNETVQEGFDQIAWVLNEIKTNPSSSRLIVSGWNPNDALAIDSTTKKPKAVLPCCHTLVQFFVEELSEIERQVLLDKEIVGGLSKAIADYCNTGHEFVDEVRKENLTREGFSSLLDYYLIPKSKLSCQLYQRSSDISIAGNINIACYALLTHMVAQQCDLAVGEFIWSLGDVHLYGNQIEDVRMMISKDTHPFPQLKLNKAKDLYSYEWSDIQIIDYKHSGKMENLKVSV